jgi:hypothetical protein
MDAGWQQLAGGLTRQVAQCSRKFSAVTRGRGCIPPWCPPRRDGIAVEEHGLAAKKPVCD